MPLVVVNSRLAKLGSGYAFALLILRDFAGIAGFGLISARV